MPSPQSQAAHPILETSLNRNSPSGQADVSILEESIRLERQTDDFFDGRAKGASPKALGELLDKAPNRAPDPGDDFED